MAVQREERRLAAILSAYVVGYSRLMGADESGTLARLKTHREETIDPKIAEHHGRIVKLMGDGVLVEFASAVDAVQCATDIQRAMADRNADVAEEQRIELRIGINLGDIIVDGDDIYGDGVNVAARLEGLAEPGGVCMSRTTRDQVRDKLDLSLKDMGEVEVKNITRPVRVFHVLVAEQDVAPPPDSPATSAGMPATSDSQSLAVLPFDNMSADAEQEFFADGLTEDIITELSRFGDLLVISRNSTFTYKGRAVKAQEVAHDLGVRYVVEGSVRKAGDRVRVTVQLVDAAEDRHAWAERYDRHLEDIFAIQDEITVAIVGTLAGRVEADRHDRARSRPTENMPAYECVLAGKVLHHRSKREENAEALHLLDRAIELDPNYAHARAWRACVLSQAWIYGWDNDPEATRKDVAEELERAIALEDNDADIHRILAAVNITRDNFDRALSHQEKALRLNPNYDLAVVQHGELMTGLGRPEEGIEWIRKSMRLNPYHPPRFWSHLGRAYFVARRYDEAIEAFEHIDSPDSMHSAFLAACHACLGDASVAAAHSREVLGRAPDFTVDAHMATMHYLSDEDRTHHRDGLLRAGLPEQ